MRTVIFVYTFAVMLLVSTAIYGYDPIVLPTSDYEIGRDYLSCPNGAVMWVEYNLSGSDDFVEVRAYFHIRNREPKEVPFLIFEYPGVEESVPARRIDLILPYQSPQPVTVEYLQEKYPSICNIPRIP